MDRLQTPAWQLLALLLAALLVWQSLARLGAERDAAQARTDLATDRQAAATAALHASERYRQREGAYRERLDFLARDTDLALARAAADADAARAAAGRLRGDLADYITSHRAAAQARAAAGQCAPDTGPADLLADMLRRADNRAGELAHVADTARTRGLACERAYDSARTMIEAARNGKAQ